MMKYRTNFKVEFNSFELLGEFFCRRLR